MNRDDVIRMAREAGGLIYEVDWCFEMENLERFAAAAFAAGAAAEREELARFFEEHWRAEWADFQTATAIRARGETSSRGKV